MDKKNNCNGNDIASSSQEEGENMPTTVKKEQSPKGLSLSTKKPRLDKKFNWLFL